MYQRRIGVFPGRFESCARTIWPVAPCYTAAGRLSPRDDAVELQRDDGDLGEVEGRRLQAWLGNLRLRRQNPANKR